MRQYEGLEWVMSGSACFNDDDDDDDDDDVVVDFRYLQFVVILVSCRLCSL